MDKSMKFKISRRNFLKMAGVATTGIMLSNVPHKSVAHAKAAVTGSCSYGGRDIPLLYEADVCVLGGGPSGVAAAVSAGKKGAEALLVEKGITLGGLQTMGNVIPCMTTWAPNSDTSFVTALKKHLKKYGIDYDDHNEKSEVAQLHLR